MLRAWRIAKERHSKAAFDGEGARVNGGRWDSPGAPVVSLAESRALALLEILVHVEREELLQSYVLFELAYDERHVVELDAALLPRGWNGYPAPARLREIGDAWCKSGQSPLFSVPSVVVPEEHNLLLNPAHPQ